MIHEWVYGQARLQVGINPGAPAALRAVKAVASIGRKRPYRDYMGVYGQVSKDRAARLYDAYVHLPVEFPMKTDGHRPVSEPFRQLSDELLLEAIDQMGIEYHVIGGAVSERIARIVETFNLPLKMSIDEAVDQAEERVSQATAVLEEDDKFKAAQRKKSVARRLAYAMRY